MLDDLTRIQHMRDSAREAIGFLRDRTRSDLDHDRMLALALVKSIEIIGEAANQVSSLTQERFPEIPWRPLIAMRHRTVHGYIDINYGIVWETIKERLPGLADDLDRVIAQLASS